MPTWQKEVPLTHNKKEEEEKKDWTGEAKASKPCLAER